MKHGYKHKTGVFGTDAERYTSQLFLMFKNPNGHRRPDLISLNGRLSPKLSIEVKSGRKMKGVMVDYQLHYAITTQQDYIDLFGEEPPQRTDLLPGVDTTPLPKEYIAYYYNVINRFDELSAQDLDKPFSAIRIKWGNQYLVPHEFGFYNFAINMARRTDGNVEEAIEYLKEIMRQDVLNGTSHYQSRKADRNSWQDLHARDIIAIFDNRPAFATKEGKERIALITKHYKELRELQRIKIPAANGTSLYILAKPEDHDLLDRQFRTVIQERVPVIERVTRERRESRPLLDRIETKAMGLYESGSESEKDIDFPEQTTSNINLSRDEILKLNRLCHWLSEGETKVSLPEKPDDDIPF